MDLNAKRPTYENDSNLRIALGVSLEVNKSVSYVKKVLSEAGSSKDLEVSGIRRWELGCKFKSYRQYDKSLKSQQFQRIMGAKKGAVNMTSSCFERQKTFFTTAHQERNRMRVKSKGKADCVVGGLHLVG